MAKATLPAKSAVKPIPGKAPGKAVQPANAAATALGIPSQMAEVYAAHAGAGLENATASDYALPFIALLQSLSPQVDKKDDKFIPGAETGMWFNTVTNRLYGESIRVIPVDFTKVYNEWVPRDAGGGFVKSWSDKSEAEVNVQEGNNIVDTANHYALVYNDDEDTWEQGILSFTSTKLKASRNWLSRISQVLIPVPGGGKKVAPSFARQYNIMAVQTENAKGKFYIPQVAPIEGAEGWTTPSLFQMALDFATQLKAGQKGADFSKMGEEVVDGEVSDNEPEM